MTELTAWASAYVLNSVWQIPALALCTWAMVKMTSRAGARLHYRLWVGCLLLSIALPAAPRISLPHWDRHPVEQTGTKNAAAPVLTPDQPEPLPVYIDRIVAPAETSTTGRVILWLYVLSVLIGAVKLLRELAATRAVVHRARPAVLPETLAVELERASSLLNVKVAEVRLSAELQCPATVSWPRPMLLAQEDFAALPVQDAAAAIAHELAHIKRRDFIVNVVLEIVSLPGFYHPALHWVKRNIVEMREVVCDEVAAGVTLGRTAYAHSLVSLAEGAVGRETQPDLLLGMLEKDSIEANRSE